MEAHLRKITRCLRRAVEELEQASASERTSKEVHYTVTVAEDPLFYSVQTVQCTQYPRRRYLGGRTTDDHAVFCPIWQDT